MHSYSFTDYAFTAENVRCVCASFTLDIDMKLHSNKSIVVRVGPRFKKPCEPVMLCNKPLSFASDVKYLGVCLVAGLQLFKVYLHKFCRSFNSCLLHVFSANPETVVMQL